MTATETETTGVLGVETMVKTSRIYNRGPHNLVEVNLLKVNMMPETEIV
jgi:hypothetical protein